MSDRESAVLAWYNNPSTKAEIKVVRGLFPELTNPEAALFVLAVEILSNLTAYGSDCDPECECEDCLSAQSEMDDDEDDEPWKRGVR